MDDGGIVVEESEAIGKIKGIRISNSLEEL